MFEIFLSATLKSIEDFQKALFLQLMGHWDCALSFHFAKPSNTFQGQSGPSRRLPRPMNLFFSHITVSIDIQETDTHGQFVDLASPEAAGCGLLLCESCALALAHEHDGDLADLVAAIENDEEQHPMGLRADVDILLLNGELLRQLLGRASS